MAIKNSQLKLIRIIAFTVLISLASSLLALCSSFHNVADTIKVDTLGKKVKNQKIKKYPSNIKLKMYGDSYNFDETAFSQGKSTIYFKNYNLFLQKLSFGLHDRVDLEFIVLPYPIEGSIPWGIGIKYAMPINKQIHLAYKSNLYALNNTTVWRNTIITTIGNLDYNGSLSFNFIRNSYHNTKEDEIISVIGFNGKFKLSTYTSILFENLNISHNLELSFIGFEFKRHFWSVNVGLLLVDVSNYMGEAAPLNGFTFSAKIPLASDKKQ